MTPVQYVAPFTFSLKIKRKKMQNQMQNAKRLKNTLFLGGFSAATNQPPNILHGLTSEHFLVKACRYVDSFKWSAYVHCVAIGYIKMALCFSLALPEKIMGFLLAPLMLCFYQILALIGLTILIGKPTPFHVLCSGSHSHSLTLSHLSHLCGCLLHSHCL